MTRSITRPAAGPILAAATALAALLAAPALAQEAGDPTKGEAEFRKCKSCHSIVADDGTEFQKGGKTGPNLWGVIGRPVGGGDFNYSEGLKSLGDGGMVWDEEMLAAYLVDPTAWLKEQTGDPAARSKMSFKLPRGNADVAAYLATFSPEEDGTPAEGDVPATE